MSKSEVTTVTLTLSEPQAKTFASGSEVLEIEILENAFMIGGKKYKFNLYRGELTLQHWTKSGKPKAKTAPKDI